MTPTNDSSRAPRGPDEGRPLSSEARSVERTIREERRTSQGFSAAPKELLQRWSAGPAADADLAGLLFEDFCQRLRQDESVSVADYREHCPTQEQSVAELVRQQDFQCAPGAESGSSTASLRLPSVHDQLFGFRLLHELGHGAFARVFLAEQLDLAGRPVVLKVSGIVGHEPQTLAQLQHTHIMPIYSLHEDVKAGLRAVCMPFFGGMTLGQLMQSVWAGRRRPAHGEALVRALEAQPQLAPVPGAAAAAASLEWLRSHSYVQAVVWIVAGLAEGLQHAHQRGVFHRDIKPSNILISAEGQPLLLDFNLAHNRHECPPQALLGGTVTYMGPEHLRALASSDATLTRKVDQRADIYSLGMVLYEMLVGHQPFQQGASYAPMRELIQLMAAERSRGLPLQRLPDLAPSLESIVRKCLEPNPDRRYQQAEHLAEDLRRFLDDRPLRYAAERSWRERGVRWLRRHPRLSSAGSVATLAAAVLVVGLTVALEIRSRLSAAEARENRLAFESGTMQTLCLLNTTSEVQDHVRRGSTLAEETLGRYQVLDRDDWQQQPAWQRLTPEERLRLGEDVRELLLLLARARVSVRANDPAEVRRALALLDRSDALTDLPPAPAVWRYRELYHDLLGDSAQARAAQARAEQTPAVTARDFLFLARSSALNRTRSGFLQALAYLDQALQLEPRHYWALMLRGSCYRELGDYASAAGDFGQAIGQMPELAWGYYNRGCVLDQLGKTSQAVRDYSAALQRAPDFIDAILNRGMALQQQGQCEAALADFTRARVLGRDDAFVHAGLGMALEGLQRHSEADAAFAAAVARSATAADDVRARLQLSYGFAVAARLPDRAREAFAAVLALQPQHPQALYGQALLLAAPRPGDTAAATQARLDQALQLFDTALQRRPQFPEARRFRAVLAARRGRLAQAFQDIDECLEADPESGAALYAAACVAALAAAADPMTSQNLTARAMTYLEQALAHGYGRATFATDSDLAALHQHRSWSQLMTNTQGR